MQIYALTDETLMPRERFLDMVDAAIDGGARMIQFREKRRAFEESVALGRDLAALCAERGVPLIVNDSISLAVAIGADGVHLGKDDAGITDARAVLGARAIVGVSCYADVNRALDAQSAAASYVAFGACFPSRTKPEAPHVELEVVRHARAALFIPMCGIGGITAANAPLMVEAGADMVAVCDAVFGGSDVRERTRAIVESIRLAEDARRLVMPG